MRLIELKGLQYKNIPTSPSIDRYTDGGYSSQLRAQRYGGAVDEDEMESDGD